MSMSCGCTGSQACGRASKGVCGSSRCSLCEIVRLAAHRPSMLPHQSICLEVHERLNGFTTQFIETECSASPASLTADDACFLSMLSSLLRCMVRGYSFCVALMQSARPRSYSALRQRVYPVVRPGRQL